MTRTGLAKEKMRVERVKRANEDAHAEIEVEEPGMGKKSKIKSSKSKVSPTFHPSVVEIPTDRVVTTHITRNRHLERSSSSHLSRCQTRPGLPLLQARRARPREEEEEAGRLL